MTVTNQPEGIDMSQNMTEDEYNALAARLFADYCMGKRPDYLPSKYTGTEEQTETLTEQQRAKVEEDAQQWALDMIDGNETEHAPIKRTHPTPTDRTNAHKWATDLINNK